MPKILLARRRDKIRAAFLGSPHGAKKGTGANGRRFDWGGKGRRPARKPKEKK